MRIYHGFHDKSLRTSPRSVAIGIFDGVHLGHLKILSKTLREARRLGALSTVVTFEPHPNKVLMPNKKHPIIMSLQHRLRLFEKLGIDETVVVGFNKKFSKTTHEIFLKSFLVKRLGLRTLCVGPDFCFGCRGLGDTNFLGVQSQELGFSLFLVPPLKMKGEVVSSTRIRHLVEQGELEKAGRMLGRPVSVYGNVIRGRGRGRSIGFPTANLNPHHETLPPAGVYAAWGYLGKKKLKGVIHIGERPTFEDKEKSLEVHFLNFHKDIYGKEIELIFVEKIRPIKRFKSPKELTVAITSDIQKARRILSK